tara:strand:+ start:257 stop:547 length:291 start_codon:yes stop_codon:yes gene_type:complete
LPTPDSKVELNITDPLVKKLVKLIAKRSNEGALEYGSVSILERIQDPKMLIKDALEESIDQSIYLSAALHLLNLMEEEDKESENRNAISEIGLPLS